MKKIVMALVVVASGTAGIFAISGRGTQEIKGLVKASANKAVGGVTESFSEGVHDTKTDQEIKAVKLELIDKKVAMSLSQRRIDGLAAEVAALEGSVERRQRLLAEAYPVLKQALDDGVKTVKFANEEQALGAFQVELDDLIAAQDRETRQLEVKRDGLARLKKSAEEGDAAVADMRRSLDSTEQEVAVLRSRREQAEIESQTLDLVSAATTDTDSVATSLNASVERLRANVDETEARNEARRGVASVSERSRSSNISRSFNRIETLKAIFDGAKPSAPKQTQPPKSDSSATSAKTTTLDASKVIINIEGSQPSK